MRVFVYINTNSTQGHITIHCETKQVCPHVLQQILKNNVLFTCSIQDISINKDKSVIKFAETDNSYWLLLHIKSCNCEGILKEVQNILLINNIDISIGVNLCKVCA